LNAEILEMRLFDLAEQTITTGQERHSEARQPTSSDNLRLLRALRGALWPGWQPL